MPHADAAANAASAGLLVHALTTEPAYLLLATRDRLHQHYRASAMPESARLLDDLRAAGIAAVVSGAGPSVLALVTEPMELCPLAAAGFRRRGDHGVRVGAQLIGSDTVQPDLTGRHAHRQLLARGVRVYCGKRSPAVPATRKRLRAG